MTQFKWQGLIFVFLSSSETPEVSFYFSKFQCAGHQPISVADFGCRVNRVKRLTSWYLYNMCFFVTSIWGTAAQQPTPPPPPTFGARLSRGRSERILKNEGDFHAVPN
jgi:hypothetical protein